MCRIDWATLPERTYDVDVLQCPCGGRLRFIDVITDPRAAAAILDRLGIAATAAPLGRPRAFDFGPPPDW